MDVAISTSHPLRRPRAPRAAWFAAGTAVAAGLTAAAAALGASAPETDPAMNGLLRGAMVATPMAAGLCALHTRHHAAFGRLLLGVGLVAFATSLAESADATPYTIGRSAGWVLELLLVCLLLAYPHGRLRDRRDRRLVAAMAAVLAFFYVPTLFLAAQLRLPSPYTSCTRDCPASVLKVVGQQPAFVAPLVGAGSLLVFAISVTVLVRLQHRLGAASPLQRRVLLPVLAVGMLRASLVGSAIVWREFDAGTAALHTSARLIAWSTPLIALAFLVGMLRARLFSEQALRGLAAGARRRPDVPSLQRAFAEALDAPGLRIALAREDEHGAWTDCRGHPIDEPAAEPGRTVRLVRDSGGTVVAAISCDEAPPDPELLDDAAAIAAVTLDNLSLAARAEASDRELRRSRARIAAAADRERRRIERDLHDGAQQRLVALRIELGLAEDLALRDPERCARHLHQLESAIDEALEELRALAHGVCPPLLADRGLIEALKAATGRCTVPARLEARDVGRYPPEVESAVYFCIIEALQNVAKHAGGARRVQVTLDGDAQGDLRFSVRDDGPGSPAALASDGAGLTNMRDRIAAIGGELRITSRPGAGIEVRGTVPAPQASRLPAQDRST